ncbi:hypothetical protein [Leptospira interrogans]|uniref:hypothetical protein n=1 Tax=Leptospira interrogans TaxID=173 RepID=UPI00000DFA58
MDLYYDLEVKRLVFGLAWKFPAGTIMSSFVYLVGGKFVENSFLYEVGFQKIRIS